MEIFNWNTFIEWGGIIGTVAGIIGMIFAIQAFLESRKVKRIFEADKKRLDEKITFVLKSSDDRQQELPPLRRQDVSRSEILGRIGTIPKKITGHFYSIEYTITPDFYEQIDKVKEGSEKKHSVLIIKCTPEEFNQFDFDERSVNTNQEKSVSIDKPVKPAKKRHPHPAK